MKLYAMFLMNIERGTPETDAVFAHLKNHTIISLNIRKLLGTVGRENVPQEMFEKHKESSKELGRLLGKCFADQPDIELEDCKWDTDHVMTKAEQALILAPEG